MTCGCLSANRNPKHLKQPLRIDRFCDMVVHAGVKAFLYILSEGVSGHGYNGHGFCVRPFQRPYLSCGREAVITGIRTSIRIAR